jgi:hypothetical protein
MVEAEGRLLDSSFSCSRPWFQLRATDELKVLGNLIDEFSEPKQRRFD